MLLMIFEIQLYRLGMECDVNDTNYRCSDFTAHFSSGKEMCETFFPEQLMGDIIIDVVRPGNPCIIPGRDQPTYLGYIYWSDRSFDPLHKANLTNPLLLQNLTKRALLKLNIGIVSKTFVHQGIRDWTTPLRTGIWPRKVLNRPQRDFLFTCHSCEWWFWWHIFLIILGIILFIGVVGGAIMFFTKRTRSVKGQGFIVPLFEWLILRHWLHQNR